MPGGYSYGGHSGYKGWPHSGTGPYETGPAQHIRYPEELGNNPSQESLTRARYEDFSRHIDAINNKGSVSRLEDALQYSRGAAAQQMRRTGMDPNSTAAVQLQTNVQSNTLDSAFQREADMERQMRLDRASLRGRLAEMEQTRANSLFDQYRTQQQLALADRQMKLVEKEAARTGSANSASAAMRNSLNSFRA